MGWEFLWIFAIIALVLSAVGFYKFVYFLSIGYGFSVAGIGLALAIMSIAGVFQADVAHYILFALLVVYGVRLSGFLLIRELKNISFKKTEVFKDTLNKSEEKAMPVFVKATIWICVAILYVAQTSPVFFRMYNGGETTALVWVGIAISVIAIAIEWIADQQKSAQKAKNPNKVATEGLYKIVRCPNYFGEILFWTGLFVSSLDTLCTVGQWITAILAYVAIVYIMFNGAQRLEKRQMARYGEDPEYNEYANKTPIIIPLLPIYHLNKKN